MTQENLGFIPQFLSHDDPRSAQEQLNASYLYGGGFQAFEGFTLNPDNSLKYPDDPYLPALAKVQIRDELVIFYPFAWVAVIQPDRSFVVARLD